MSMNNSTNRADVLAKVGIKRAATQLTKEELAYLKPAEIEQARKQGQLFDLMNSVTNPNPTDKELHV